jgi:hypothetical protein
MNRASRAEAETHTGVEFGRIVEVDTGVLCADIEVPKCSLESARSIHGVRSGSREHARHRPPAQLGGVRGLPFCARR